MAEDYAILVGIGKYGDRNTFPELQGPINDVQIVKDWLTSPTGGGISNPEKNIVQILSPTEEVPPNTPLYEYPPVALEFDNAFKQLVTDGNGEFVARPDSRLYLYFSGHGFCDKKSLTAQATLYAANATRNFPENIFGTQYALNVQDKALFSEIVLIMDCCRDAEINRPPSIPTINQAGNGAAGTVKLLCIYAAPKGGKAQERAFPERDGKVHGLLTHAVLKAFAEARPENGNSLSGSALKKHLLATWSAICGDIPAAAPEIVLPTGEDIFFHSQNKGVLQIFEFTKPLLQATTLNIIDGQGNSVVHCDFLPPPATSFTTGNDGEPTPLDFDGKAFSLRLQPSYYKYVLSGDLQGSSLFAVEVEGGPNVKL